jgi:hypothetical protein
MNPGKLTEFWYPVPLPDTLGAMPPESESEHAWRDERGWREFAASNRERIVAVEANAARQGDELLHLRQRQHELAQAVGLVQVLAEQVRNIASDVSTLTTDVRATTDRLARVVERPTAPLIVQFLALLVAVAAIVVAVTR